MSQFQTLESESFPKRLSLLPSSGEREEVHAAGGQPEAERRGEEFYVQQAHLRPVQH